MSVEGLHQDAIVIDGLVVSKWSREVFEDMHRGGLTAANCTCAVWEGFRDTVENIAQWKQWFHDHDDLLLQVYSTADIERAKATSKVGIFLGWQNTYPLEDRVDFVQLFQELGVRVMQLTYNTQNLVGSGCWESSDGGLSDFGRDVVDEMNRTGVLVDLSHVGPQTTEDAILHSRQPVAFTHCCPTGIMDHPRNKTDAQLRMVADRGGFVGVATYPPFLPWGNETTLAHCIDVFEYMIDIAGEDHVGIGTDFTQGHDLDFFRWLRSDKGGGRSLSAGDITIAKTPAGLERLSDYPNLTEAMVQRGWAEARIRKVLGGNWMRLLQEVWGT